MPDHAIPAPAHPVLSLDLSSHHELSAMPFGVLTSLESWLVPLLSRLGAAVNKAALVGTITAALKAGGGVPAVLKAVMDNLAKIAPGASPAVLEALKVAIEALLLYFDATPAAHKA